MHKNLKIWWIWGLKVYPEKPKLSLFSLAPCFAVVSLEDYKRLKERAEMMAYALETVNKKSPWAAPNYAGQELDKYNKFKEE